MARSWCTPSMGKKGQHPSGEVIGEIFFELPLSATLTSFDKEQLNNLTDLLKTVPVGFDPAQLLLLGDTDQAEALQPRADIATSRAKAVEAYLRSQLPPQAANSVKIESAGKGAPFPKPSPGGVRRRVVEIVNKGKPIIAFTAPPKKAATKEEAFQAAVAAAKQAPADKEEEFKRIMHWLVGPGKASLENGDDAYVNSASQSVINLAVIGSKPLGDTEFRKLIDENRIMRMMMEVAAVGNPAKLIIEMLLDIDAGILAGIDFLVEKAARESSTFSSQGLGQLRNYVAERADKKESFYWIYFQGTDAPRVSHPVGRWKVKVDKWTWIYEFDWAGVRWTDPVNKQTGTGKWRLLDFKGTLVFTWDKSDTQETWKGPLLTQGTKGTCTMKGITYNDLLAVKL